MALAEALYGIGIRAYGVAIWLVRPFSAKARLWVAGRSNWRVRLQQDLASIPSEGRIWLHAASLGEFEQGRPVIEALAERFPDRPIIISFFSPSGYVIRKDFPLADHVCYLPLDTSRNAQDFIKILSPSLAIFVKYEFWFQHLKALRSTSVETILVAGRFHRKQGFFKAWGSFFRKGLLAFDHFFLQDEHSLELARELGLEKVTMNGDTRFDRVLAIAMAEEEIEGVEEWIGDCPCLVAGSTWPYDEILLEQYIRDREGKRFKVIIAPHEIDHKRINDFVDKCTRTTAIWSTGLSSDADVLVIDSIGLLSRLYRYADVAIIGGGHGSGIHNTLEAAVWACPIIIGPRYHMFQEAVDLIDIGAARSVELQEEFNTAMDDWLFDVNTARPAGRKGAEYCRSKAGATEAVLTYAQALFSAD